MRITSEVIESILGRESALSESEYSLGEIKSLLEKEDYGQVVAAIAATRIEGLGGSKIPFAPTIALEKLLEALDDLSIYI